jgi:hypothetical protein
VQGQSWRNPKSEKAFATIQLLDHPKLITPVHLIDFSFASVQPSGLVLSVLSLRKPLSSSWLVQHSLTPDADTTYYLFQPTCTTLYIVSTTHQCIPIRSWRPSSVCPRWKWTLFHASQWLYAWWPLPGVNGTLLGKHRMIASGFPTVTKEKVGQGLC